MSNCQGIHLVGAPHHVTIVFSSRQEGRMFYGERCSSLIGMFTLFGFQFVPKGQQSHLREFPSSSLQLRESILSSWLIVLQQKLRSSWRGGVPSQKSQEKKDTEDRLYLEGTSESRVKNGGSLENCSLDETKKLELQTDTHIPYAGSAFPPSPSRKDIYEQFREFWASCEQQNRLAFKY